MTKDTKSTVPVKKKKMKKEKKKVKKKKLQNEKKRKEKKWVLIPGIEQVFLELC